MLLFWLTTLVCQRRTTRYLLLYSIAGSLAIWFSHVAILVLFSAGIYVFISEVCMRRRYGLLPVFVTWLISFAVYYVFFIQGHPSEQYMKDFWADNFLPLNPLSEEFYRFIDKRIDSMFSYHLEFGMITRFARAVYVIGLCIAIYKRMWSLVYFSVILFVVHLGISGLKLYPYSGRLILYLIPMFILPYVYGVFALFKVMQSQIRGLPEILLVFPVIYMLFPLSDAYPKEREDVKSLSPTSKHTECPVN
jgi:hypothetical protein